MLDLTNRQASELEWLCHQDGPVLVGDVAYRFHVSPRSVRNDLSQIERFAAMHHIAVERHRGKGILLVGTPSNKKALLDELNARAQRILEPEERCSLIVAMLALRDSVTFQQLADACGVSRQTAIRDFPDAEALLAKEGIAVERCQGKGLMLSGSEKSIRHAFVQLLADSSCSDIISGLIARDAELSGRASSARAIVQAAEDVLGTGFQNQDYIESLVRFVLGRIQKGHYILPGDVIGACNVAFDALPAASNMDALRQALKPYVALDSERTYLATLILSQRIGPLPSVKERNEADAMCSQAERISKHLLDALSKYQHVDNAAVKDVVVMLTEHIRAALYRRQNNIQLHDDNLEAYLQLTSPLILEFTADTLEECGVEFPQSEVTYIAMYIASIFESSGGDELVPSVLFVCSFGLATSVLLKSRLERLLFGCRLIGPKSLPEAREYLRDHEVDLVVSTCDFPEVSVPVLRVNPMLTQGDVDKVKGYVNQLPYTKMSSQFVERYTEQRNRQPVRRVSDFVRLSNIQVVDTCDSWQEAIRLAARPLVQRGLIEPRYVETMIHAVSDLGTYMVLTPETAYVHAGVDDGILDDCTAVLVSRTVIRFGSDNAKSVRTIVVLGIKHKNKSDLLGLASIFGAPENLRLLAQQDISPKDIARMHD